MKMLLLVDLNGAMWYRTEERISGVKHDTFFSHKYYYQRPGVASFFEKLHALPNVQIGVYSSMMHHNITQSFDAILPNWKDLVDHVFDRGMNKKDPNGKHEWDTMRDMDKIWRSLPTFGPKTTLIVDNEARKIQETPRNGIILPWFHPNVDDASTLDKLQVYLTKMMKSFDENDDVRTYMEKIPFPFQYGKDFMSLQNQLQGLSLKSPLISPNDEDADDEYDSEAEEEVVEKIPSDLSFKFTSLTNDRVVYSARWNKTCQLVTMESKLSPNIQLFRAMTTEELRQQLPHAKYEVNDFNA